MKIRATITGTLPLIQHNGQLANPLNEYARLIKQLSGKTKKTDADLAEIAQLEVRGGCYADDDSRLIIPTVSFIASLRDGARLSRQGKLIAEAVLPLADHALLILPDGTTPTVDAVVEQGMVCFAMMRVQQSRVPRYRPQFPAGWSAAFELNLDDEILNFHQFTAIAEVAGQRKGILEDRPRVGRYTVDMAAL